MSIVKVKFGTKSGAFYENIVRDAVEKSIAEVYEKKLSPLIEEIKKENGTITIKIDDSGTIANVDGFSFGLEKKIFDLLSEQ